MTAGLRLKAADFAQQMQDTIAGVLPGDFQMVSIAHGERFVIRADGESALEQRIPLMVDGDPLASLSVQVHLGLDSSKSYLKAWLVKLAVNSTLDRTPLVRYEFDAKVSVSAPLAHWHVHADRGALSHLLGRAHAVRPEAVRKPHELSSLHFPVGGERFRPCVEDVLEFLVREFGVDHKDGWSDAIRMGREQWRRMQFRSTVRDLQSEAAQVLRDHGWTVEAPGEPLRAEGDGVLHRW
ncbi:hypothetical protein [uncultured Microbacterium sp.]|uniref:hypothetical protein n=1 Tax=uncultured Microbacterium sp. TaxID=191216 RepID=UPI0028D6057F|nr:hypothetical protein [uncultured Microbacterium sp.]